MLALPQVRIRIAQAAAGPGGDCPRGQTPGQSQIHRLPNIQDPNSLVPENRNLQRLRETDCTQLHVSKTQLPPSHQFPQALYQAPQYAGASQRCCPSSLSPWIAAPRARQEAWPLDA